MANWFQRIKKGEFFGLQNQFGFYSTLGRMKLRKQKKRDDLNRIRDGEEPLGKKKIKISYILKKNSHSKKNEITWKKTGH